MIISGAGRGGTVVMQPTVKLIKCGGGLLVLG